MLPQPGFLGRLHSALRNALHTRGAVPLGITAAVVVGLLSASVAFGAAGGRLTLTLNFNDGSSPTAQQTVPTNTPELMPTPSPAAIRSPTPRSTLTPQPTLTPPSTPTNTPPPLIVKFPCASGQTTGQPDQYTFDVCISVAPYYGSLHVTINYCGAASISIFDVSTDTHGYWTTGNLPATTKCSLPFAVSVSVNVRAVGGYTSKGSITFDITR